MSDADESRPAVWVDADACPTAIKDLLFRTADRMKVATTLVANQSIPIPKSGFVRRITVRDGADIADNVIVDQMRAGDIVITNDVPLAARAVEKDGIAIGCRGELFDDKNVHSRLASRDLMEQFRAAGIDTAGPKPLSPKDIQMFANQLDRTLTRALKRYERNRNGCHRPRS